MADASTTRYQLIKPEVGASADTWGGKWNQNADDTDALLGAITTTGAANAYALTTGLSLAAYVTGQSFEIIANFSNSGPVTIDVDAIGAKAITKNGASALATGDIVSGNIYRISYDGTQFQLVGTTGTGVYQPLDATLTALAMLSWSSGNSLIQFTAADTISLTLTPSVSSVTASQGAAAATPSGTFVNTTDNAAVRALRIEGDRATPGANDYVYASFYLSNSSGTQTEFGRIAVTAPSVTASSETGDMRFWTMNGGSMAVRMALSATYFTPLSNDALTLGLGTLAWADLFLASGGVINWANGNFTLTHSAGLLSASGPVQARVPLSSETGTPTVASANKKQALAGGATLNAATFAADDFILFDPGASNRTITRGSGVTMYVNGTDSATATLAANQMGAAHWRSASVVVLTGAFS